MQVNQREKRKQQKDRRNEQIAEFFEEVDSNAINVFADEESFLEYTSSVQSSAEIIQKYLKIEGDDKLTYKVYSPFKHFCALVSQVTFDRKADFQIR